MDRVSKQTEKALEGALDATVKVDDLEEKMADLTAGIYSHMS